MATYFARKAGNINAADVWATTPSGTATVVTFASGDVLVANSFAITVNVSTNLGSTGQVRNDTTGGATAGGSFNFSNGVTLTANSYGGVGNTPCVSFALSSPLTANLVGDCYGGTTSSSWAARNNGTGTLSITCSGGIYGSQNSTGGGAYAVNLSGDGIINITGNCFGGNSSSVAVVNSSTAGIINLTGNANGGSAVGAYGLANLSTGQSNLTGQSIGGAVGAGTNNASTGVLRITRVVGNAYGPGNTAGLSATVGCVNSGIGVVEIQELEFGTYGQSPVSGTGIRLKKAGTNVAVFNYCDTAGAKTLIDATANAAMPAASNVRSGVSYASGALTGSCAVPAAGSVALGVPVDAGFGTAVLTPEAVWGAGTRTLTAGGGISASDVWDYASRTLTTSSGPTAVEIRQEMDSNSTKLANLDATVSSRLAPSGTLAVVTTLTNAPTVPSASTIASQVRTELTPELAKVAALVPDRLAQCSTVATTGAQLAAALS